MLVLNKLERNKSAKNTLNERTGYSSDDLTETLLVIFGRHVIKNT